MKFHDLQGVAIVVTRPELQAGNLCRLLEQSGADVIRYPVLDIEAAEPVAGVGTDEFDLIIFTSTNAVRFGRSLLVQSRGARLAAIGHATAHELELAGHADVLVPQATFDSEGLLAHPRLHNVVGARVLIVTGSGGRTLLRTQLAERGAQVAVAEVYARRPVRPSAVDRARVHAELSARSLKLITATSAEIAVALLDLASVDLREQLLLAAWVVPSARVAAALYRHGVQSRVVMAGSAEDQSLVDAILSWRASVSAA